MPRSDPNVGARSGARPHPGDAHAPSDSDGAGDAWASRVSAGIAAGSSTALAALYEAKFDLLVATVRRRTGRDESFVLDCVQDAMLRVARHLRDVDSMDSLDAFLRKAVLGAALDRLRSEHARAERERSTARGEETTRDGAIERMLEAELASLEADDRSLLRLRFARGLTLEQLARHLGLAPKAVDSRLRRLLARIRVAQPLGEERR
jgi:RNA polymerase sigma factor (sigma-70 family)